MYLGSLAVCLSGRLCRFCFAPPLSILPGRPSVAPFMPVSVTASVPVPVPVSISVPVPVPLSVPAAIPLSVYVPAPVAGAVPASVPLPVPATLCVPVSLSVPCPESEPNLEMRGMAASCVATQTEIAEGTKIFLGLELLSFQALGKRPLPKSGSLVVSAIKRQLAYCKTLSAILSLKSS